MNIQLKIFGAAILLCSASFAQTDTSNSLVRLLPIAENRTPYTDAINQEFLAPPGVSPGDGWDTYKNSRVLNRCVTGVPSGPKDNQKKNKGDFIRLQSQESFFRSLSISANASYGAFSASGNFNQIATSRKDALSIVGVADVQTQVDSLNYEVVKGAVIPGMQLTKEALLLLKKKSAGDTPTKRLNRFYAACGDSFISDVTYGLLWMGQFDEQFTESTLRREIEIKAKATFGAGGGGGSAKEIVSSSQSNSAAVAKTRSVGVILGGATTAAELIKEYEAASSTKSSTTPYKVVTMSYKRAVGWPNELVDTGLSTVSSRQILGHSQRLDDLATVYREAFIAPNNFYFPFSKGTNLTEIREEASLVSDSLSHAASCLRAIEGYCLSQAKCSIADLEKPALLKKICPALQSKEAPFSQAVASLLFGETSNQKTEAWHSLVPLQMKKGGNTAKKTASKKIKQWSIQKDDAAQGAFLSPVQIFYKHLASAPLTRKWVDGADYTRPDTQRQLADETLQLEMFCTSTNTPCSFSQWADSAVPAAPQSVERIKSWALYTRALPLANEFRETEHPMNISAKELLDLMNALPVTLGEGRNFVQKPLPPPPPPPPPPKVVRPERPNDTCGPRMIRC